RSCTILSVSVSDSFCSNISVISSRSRQNGLQYTVEGYIQNIKINNEWDTTIIEAKAYRSQSKHEKPHDLFIKCRAGGIYHTLCACDDTPSLRKILRGHQDLNLGPLDLQSNALPLSYNPFRHNDLPKGTCFFCLILERKCCRAFCNKPFLSGQPPMALQLEAVAQWCRACFACMRSRDRSPASPKALEDVLFCKFQGNYPQLGLHFQEVTGILVMAKVVWSSE